jgi:uncharacterized protein HemX
MNVQNPLGGSLFRILKIAIAVIAIGWAGHYFRKSETHSQKSSRYQLPAGLLPNEQQKSELSDLQASSEATFQALHSQINALKEKLQSAQKSNSPVAPMLMQQQIFEMLTPEQRSQLQSFSAP